jgi:hypothetical protein
MGEKVVCTYTHRLAACCTTEGAGPAWEEASLVDRVCMAERRNGVRVLFFLSRIHREALAGLSWSGRNTEKAERYDCVMIMMVVV